MGLASPPPSCSGISQRSFFLQALAALLRTVTDPTAHQYGGLSSAAAPKSLLHDVFHMVFLKKYTGDSPTTTVPLLPIIHGRAVPAPAAVLRARPSSTLWDLLVQCQGHSDADATWEPLEQFKESYPYFQLEDKLYGEGSVVDRFFGHKFQT